VEDDPAASEITCAILRSRGDSPRAATTVEEALTAIAEEEFCYFVLDQQLPLDTNDPKPLITGGERVTVAVRQSDPRQNAGVGYVTPILVLSGYSSKAQFVTSLFKRGIDTFVEKDVCDRVEYFSQEVREMLEKAGRGDHAKCAALAQRVSTPVAEGVVAAPVVLAIDGKITKAGRTEIVINGARREMQDARFAVLLRCLVARERSPEAWSSREALGIARSRNATTYIREAFDGLVPDGFQAIEGDRRGNVRLNPEIVVERVDWDVLAEHPDPSVARVALERRKRRDGR
jgi:CheY-like chemotaxis protein